MKKEEFKEKAKRILDSIVISSGGLKEIRYMKLVNLVKEYTELDD